MLNTECSNKAIEPAPVGRPTRKGDAPLLAAHRNRLALMNRKRFLMLATSLTALTAAAFVFVPFSGSLSPSATAGADLPRLKIDELAPGSMAWFDIERRVPYGQRYLVVRFQDGAVDVFAFTSKEGLVGMPDIHWWRPGMWCKQFELQDPDALVAPDSVLRCKDEDIGEWASTEWRWTLNGRNLGKYTDDLDRPRYVVESGEVVVGKS